MISSNVRYKIHSFIEHIQPIDKFGLGISLVTVTFCALTESVTNDQVTSKQPPKAVHCSFVHRPTCDC